MAEPERQSNVAVSPADSPSDHVARTRRGFIGAALAAIASAIVIAILWLIARGAPSAGRDPALTTPSQ